MHTCSSHNRFFKFDFKKTLLVRTRVQTVAFFGQTFDFCSGFVVHFENTTKLQREAQKYHLQHTISTLSRRLQWFWKSPHKKTLQNRRLLSSRRARPNPLDKNRGLENTCAPNPKENTISSRKRFKCERAGGTRIKPRKTKRFSELNAGSTGQQNRDSRPGNPHAEGQR